MFVPRRRRYTSVTLTCQQFRRDTSAAFTVANLERTLRLPRGVPIRAEVSAGRIPWLRIAVRRSPAEAFVYSRGWTPRGRRRIVALVLDGLSGTGRLRE